MKQPGPDPLRRALLRLACGVPLGALDAPTNRPGVAFLHAGYFPPTDDRQDPYVTAGTPAAVLAHARRTCHIVGGAAIATAADGGVRLHYQRYGSFNALCDSEPFWEQPTVLERRDGVYEAFGYTGYLIGPDTVLTCWHGWEQAGSEAQFAVFDYALRGDGTPPTDLPPDRVRRLVAEPVAGATAPGAADVCVGDWVVLRLERRVQHLGPVGAVPVASPRLARKVYTLGYPRGLPLKLAGNARVRELGRGTFRADLDTYVGNSGSPVFDATSHALVGLVVEAQKGEGDFEASPALGCYVSHRIERHITGQLMVSAGCFAGALREDHRR